MSSISDVTDRTIRRLDSILGSIDAGEDPQPAVARLHDAAPWEVAALGLAAMQDAVERINEADEQLAILGD